VRGALDGLAMRFHRRSVSGSHYVILTRSARPVGLAGNTKV